MKEGQAGLFGTRKQTELLVLLQLLGESITRELARLLNISPSNAQAILDKFERLGIVATRKLGIERRAQINPRFFARKELASLLSRMAEADPELQRIAESVRRRPRRRDKPLERLSDDLAQ